MICRKVSRTLFAAILLAGIPAASSANLSGPKPPQTGLTTVAANLSGPKPSQTGLKKSCRIGVVFWNLENFFDYIDTAGTDALRMSKKNFYKKCDDVGKTFLWIGDEMFAGKLPDVIGVAEVENAFVMRKIVACGALVKTGYRYIHYESPASRGIDNGILYNPATIRPLQSGRRHIFNEDGSIIPTRDIVWMTTSDSIAYLVNHHPSKYGGARRSEPARRAAVKSLQILSDSLSREGFSIVAMGDFNDTPQSDNFKSLEQSLDNKANALSERGEGTIRYEGKWELIDMFWVSWDISQFTEMKIARPPFLLENDPRHGSLRPHRTYSGPRYLGGVSDHLPIALSLFPE